MKIKKNKIPNNVENIFLTKLNILNLFYLKSKKNIIKNNKYI